ncbi:hypothetical protein PR002_g22822 [Phytophthora rubi]|uniref:Uncharacterized protein n=1 Tax=Phytophthora rubi TaxID=129364 RepID=A0A6A3IPB9_9STRA|nr:hypothetical protein PR002_g22822 [Phytophthora rubi]
MPTHDWWKKYFRGGHWWKTRWREVSGTCRRQHTTRVALSASVRFNFVHGNDDIDGIASKTKLHTKPKVEKLTMNDEMFVDSYGTTSTDTAGTTTAKQRSEPSKLC